jgi:hypothetical protein
MGVVPGSTKRVELLLALASLLVFLGAAEVATRLLRLGEPRPTGYAPVNTTRGTKQRLNSRGYRDRETLEVKPPGGRRVVSLGDSFAWGAGVELEDAYPDRLERILNRRRPEPWEVVNLARPGMNTVDHAAQLDAEGMALAPDVVLLGYVLNDAEEAAAAEARQAAGWTAPRPWGPLGRSALARWVWGRLWATAEGRRRVAGYRSLYRNDAPGWQQAQQALAAMGRLCHRRGVPFLVAIFPLFGNRLDESYPFADIHSRVAAAAAGAGARVIDLLPTFQGLRWEVLVVDGVDDEHPNEIAHRLAAAAIRPVVEDSVSSAQGPELRGSRSP